MNRLLWALSPEDASLQTRTMTANPNITITWGATPGSFRRVRPCGELGQNIREPEQDIHHGEQSESEERRVNKNTTRHQHLGRDELERCLHAQLRHRPHYLSGEPPRCSKCSSTCSTVTSPEPKPCQYRGPPTARADLRGCPQARSRPRPCPTSFSTRSTRRGRR